MEQIHTLAESTLGELRKLVATTETMPDAAPVRVRTRMTWSADGAAVTRVHVGEAKRR